MLNFNFLNNFKHWGEALHVIENKMPHKLADFRKSMEENNMEASIWCVEETKKYIEEYYTKTGSLRVLILNSWLGVPLVPLLCENMDVAQIHMVDIDEESIELSKIFHKHYAQEKFVNIRHWNLDVPFEFENLNKIDVDLVICLCTEQLYPLAELNGKNPQAIYAIQNSNVVEEMFGINCVGSIEDLKKQVNIEECGYEGTKKQTYYSWDGKKEYDRFMIIGQREGFF
mgnify:FL=1|tara:strand:+ start:19002 stop:19685 length:684 start_codon:yes stop_codon:yes gene_type:complete